MKIDFSKYDFAEAIEIDGIKKIQYRKRGDSHIIMEEYSEDTNLKKLKDTSVWGLPGDLEGKDIGKNDEFFIDHDAREGESGHIPTVLKNIAQEMDMIFSEHYSFIDPRYSTLFTMFVLDTFFKNYFDYAPRILIKGDSQSGKSRVMELVRSIGYRVKQSVSVSEAALYRSVEMFNVTYLYDESQDINEDSRPFFNTIWKGGAAKGGGVVERCDEQNVPMPFNCYSPMIKSVLTGYKDKNDVENRTFIVHTRKKDGVKLKRQDENRLKELRTALFRIKIRLERYPRALDLKSLAIKSDDEFIAIETTKEEIEKAEKEYPILYKYKQKEGSLDNRAKDMSIPYYTLAKITGFEEEIISLCYEMKEIADEADRESFQGRILRIWGNIAIDPNNYETTIETLSLKYPKDRIFNISSKDIKEAYCKEAIENGEKPIGTHSVTNIIEGWGFEWDKERKTQGQRFIADNRKNRDTFNQLLVQYGDEDQQLNLRLV